MLILLKAKLLLCLIASTKATTGKGNLPNLQVISNIIQQLLQPDLIDQYVRPYIQSLQFPKTNHNAKEPVFRVTDDVSIEKAIKAKVDDLKPFLQDNEADELDNDHKDENDTTIIEFIPKTKYSENKTAFKISTENFKKLRNKIKRALEKENVTSKTRKLVIKTLDGMLANMVNNTCTYKAVDPEKVLRDGQNIDSLLKKKNLSLPEWEHFKQSFVNFNNDNDLKEVLKMFKPFYNYFNKYMKQLETDKYVVTCRLNLKDRSNDLRRTKKRITAKDPCNGFKLCSEELKSFLADFYNSLNDTLVSVFRNYAAMYERDVTIDSSIEKEAVISELNKAGDKAEKKVKKIFKKELMQLNFDKGKNTKTNVKILKEYIKNNVHHIKTHTIRHLENELKALKAKLLLIVKEDLDVNIDVDLGNLQGEFESKICRIFSSCNGAYFARRTIVPWKNTHLKDKNSVYVKVSLNLDKQLKDTVFRSNRQLLGVDKLKRHANRRLGNLHKVDLLKYTSDKFSITRTTLINNSTTIIPKTVNSTISSVPKTAKSTLTKDSPDLFRESDMSI
ncbi:hypothetical protein K1T71_009925 [Dendrolimus kikuchii]|uniref:Uncharacterized protein n=1 Tax=Dendrolimus kikuchii TaxID=765133 RepID=A0ACC1CU38_9NEOP|nr:hypothetical protein K1T71_009925 [Dendrolimus kikuchii]